MAERGETSSFPLSRVGDGQKKMRREEIKQVDAMEFNGGYIH